MQRVKLLHCAFACVTLLTILCIRVANADENKQCQADFQETLKLVKDGKKEVKRLQLQLSKTQERVVKSMPQLKECLSKQPLPKTTPKPKPKPSKPSKDEKCQTWMTKHENCDKEKQLLNNQFSKNKEEAKKTEHLNDKLRHDLNEVTLQLRSKEIEMEMRKREAEAYKNRWEAELSEKKNMAEGSQKIVDLGLKIRFKLQRDIKTLQNNLAQCNNEIKSTLIGNVHEYRNTTVELTKARDDWYKAIKEVEVLKGTLDKKNRRLQRCLKRHKQSDEDAEQAANTLEELKNKLNEVEKKAKDLEEDLNNCSASSKGSKTQKEHERILNKHKAKYQEELKKIQANVIRLMGVENEFEKSKSRITCLEDENRKCKAESIDLVGKLAVCKSDKP